jgi:hypothetical protein
MQAKEKCRHILNKNNFYRMHIHIFGKQTNNRKTQAKNSRRGKICKIVDKKKVLANFISSRILENEVFLFFK